IRGQVTEVIPARKEVKEQGGTLTLAFDKLETPSGFGIPLSASVASMEKSNARGGGTLGASAAGGVSLGRVIGPSSKEAAPGLAGGPGGTAIASGTRGKEVEIPAGSRVVVTLNQPLTIAIQPQP